MKIKTILFPIIFILFAILLTSCNSNKGEDYILGKDGLIYSKGNHRLFNGEITDTINVIIQYSVIKGKKNGLFITRYLDGKLEKFGFIENNMNVGEWKYYYPNGRIESIGNFENSKAEGRWSYYYSNGSIKSEGSYVNSIKEGKWTLYNPSGDIINIMYYQNGEVVKVQNRVS
jgi:antitoxin component YwqK of YwqJK toxin-antitoxin module